MIKSFVLLASFALAFGHDVTIGKDNNGRKIFDQEKIASPAIWRQTENVTINTTDSEVISKIVVTDLRPEKDGDVKIVEGGTGQRNVTLELKSPTVLRGFNFHIEVYSAPEGEVRVEDVTTEKEALPPSATRVNRNPEDTPKNTEGWPRAIATDEQSTTAKISTISMATDMKVNDNDYKDGEDAAFKDITSTTDSATKITFGNDVTTEKASIESNERQVRDTKKENETKTDERKPSVPSLVNDNIGALRTNVHSDDKATNIKMTEEGSDEDSIPPSGLVKVEKSILTPADKDRNVRKTEDEIEESLSTTAKSLEEAKTSTPVAFVESRHLFNNSFQGENQNAGTVKSFYPLPYSTEKTQTNNNGNKNVPSIVRQ